MRAAFLSLTLGLASITSAIAAGEPNVLFVPPDDPAMAQAVQKARATLPGFLRRASHPSPGMHDFAVKVGLGPTGGKEFFWLTPFHVEGDMLVGTLDNEPEIVKGYTKGQTVKLPLGEVTDWDYFDGNRLVGNFSACVLEERQGKEALQRFEKRFSIDCAAQR